MPTVENSNSDEISLSLIGRLKLAFLFLSLFGVLVVHIPALPLVVQAFGHGLTNLVGQEHRWTMFSADPRGDSLDLWAQMVLEDGRTREWRIDRHRPGGDLAYYHWVKWMETAVLAPEKARLPQLAEWLVLNSPDTISEVVIYGERRLGPPVGEPPPPSEVVELERYVPWSP